VVANAGAPFAAPHDPQKALPSVKLAPHFVQCDMDLLL